MIKPDLIFLTKNAKYKAIVEDVKERHEKGPAGTYWYHCD